MRRRVSIRTRLAITFALLATALLAAALTTVYLVERGRSDDRLASDASAQAAALAAALGSGSAEERDDEESASASTATRAAAYLAGRAGEDALLLVVGTDGSTRWNVPAAATLAPRASARADGAVAVDGHRYVLATGLAADGSVVAAAVPATRARAELDDLLNASILVGLAGVLVTSLAAWLAAARALQPLRRIAVVAARVSGGDLSPRLSERGRHDEIASVATAIDEMLDRLQAAFESQDRFVQDASHELRTPLTIARGHLEVTALTEPSLSAEGRAALELAISELDRMALLTDGLLRLARVHAAGRDESRTVDLSTVAADAVARARGLAEREVVVDVPPGGVTVSGDAGALQQIVLNLLANAVRHTADGGRISVTVRAERATAVLEVADDGEGIPAELLPHVFDRFRRADAARGRSTGGTGLGLAICRSIAELHGGTITADSPPGEGARLTVVLPRAAT